MFSFFGGGHGGHSDADGLSHSNAPISTATIPPLEILEAAYPVRFTQWALRANSGGDGQHRGGLGAVYEIELLEKVDGWCWLLGGESTAYIHRVKRSSWEDYAGPRRRPQSSLEEEAYNLVQLIENGTLTNKNDFLRRVRNSMIFHDLPPEFIPEIEEKDN